MSKRFGFWPHITHVIVLTFKEIKHLSDYRTIGLSDYRSDPIFFILVSKTYFVFCVLFFFDLLPVFLDCLF